MLFYLTLVHFIIKSDYLHFIFICMDMNMWYFRKPPHIIINFQNIMLIFTFCTLVNTCISFKTNCCQAISTWSFKLIHAVFVTWNFILGKNFLVKRILIVKLFNLKSYKSINNWTVTFKLNVPTFPLRKIGYLII